MFSFFELKVYWPLPRFEEVEKGNKINLEMLSLKVALFIFIILSKVGLIPNIYSHIFHMAG